jgi:hypothetical protein
MFAMVYLQPHAFRPEFFSNSTQVTIQPPMSIEFHLERCAARGAQFVDLAIELRVRKKPKRTGGDSAFQD